MLLSFKWTVSKARDTYGYNVVTLRANGTKVAQCNGGGYDMIGTCLGDWIANSMLFREKLLKFKTEFYGLTFHNPHYDPGKRIIEGQTVEEREKEGKSVGLERYQSFYSASSPFPTKLHNIPSINGACGFSSVEAILKELGYFLDLKSLSVHYSTNLQEYALKEL